MKQLTADQLKKLAQYDCRCPWTPWQMLELIKIIEEKENHIEELEDLVARYPSPLDEDWPCTLNPTATAS